MAYSPAELRAVLCNDGLPIEHSFVQPPGEGRMLYRVDQRGVVYFDVIEDAKLFEACMDYLTTLGLAYETEEAAVAAWREARAAET